MSEKRKRITVSVKTKLNALETLHKKLEKGRHATRRGQDNHIKFGKVHRIYMISSQSYFLQVLAIMQHRLKRNRT